MKKIILTTLMLALGIGIGIGVTAQVLKWCEPQSELEPELTVGSTLPIAGSTYNLAGSGITSSGASITLQSLTIPQNGYEIQDTDLSDTFYITLEPGSTKRQEIVSCTTVAQNSNDTATLSGCIRGLSPITPFTTSSTLKFAHAGGTQVIFSDPPQLFNQYVSLANNETVTGKKTFNVLPESSLSATTSNQFTIKSYVDNLVNQGAATSTEAVAGISELATRVENASSTAWGATEPHVQQSEHSSSTPSDNAFTDGVVWDVWSENDGKLNQLWLDLTEGFTFSNVTTTSFTIGTVNLSEIANFSTATGTAIGNLTTGSTTDASFWHNHSEIISYFTSTTPSTITGQTAGTIFTKTITGGDMGETGILRMTILGEGDDASTPPLFSQLVIKFGGESLATTTALSGGNWRATVDIYNLTSATQLAMLSLVASQQDGTTESTQASSTSMTVDTSSDQILLIVADNATAGKFIQINTVDIQLIR